MGPDKSGHPQNQKWKVSTCGTSQTWAPMGSEKQLTTHRVSQKCPPMGPDKSGHNGTRQKWEHMGSDKCECDHPWDQTKVVIHETRKSAPPLNQTKVGVNRVIPMYAPTGPDKRIHYSEVSTLCDFTQWAMVSRVSMQSRLYGPSGSSG